MKVADSSKCCKLIKIHQKATLNQWNIPTMQTNQL